jgi:hypothetical protein
MSNLVDGGEQDKVGAIAALLCACVSLEFALRPWIAGRPGIGRLGGLVGPLTLRHKPTTAKAKLSISRTLPRFV